MLARDPLEEYERWPVGTLYQICFVKVNNPRIPHHWYLVTKEGTEKLISGQNKLDFYRLQLFPKYSYPQRNRINKIPGFPASVSASHPDYFVNFSGGELFREDVARETEPYTHGAMKEHEKELGVHFETVWNDFEPKDAGVTINFSIPFFADVNAFKFREYPAYIGPWRSFCRSVGENFLWNGRCDYLPIFVRHAFKTATRFTPYLRAQAEGYFFSNDKNEITGGECLVFFKLPKELLQSLISECLVREMGLPDASLVFPNTLLGRWGKPFEAISKPVVPAGKNKSRLSIKGVYDLESPHAAKDAGFLKGIAAITARHQLPKEMTAYDKLILRILYDPRIKPGMTIEEARQVLPDIVQELRQK